MLEEKGLERIC